MRIDAMKNKIKSLIGKPQNAAEKNGITEDVPIWEEPRIRGGDICIWGEWVGRPHDGNYIFESIQWEETENHIEMTIHFTDGKILQISEPKYIINNNVELIIGEAEKVVFSWYWDGKRTEQNLRIRQYTKNRDGRIRRAEGSKNINGNYGKWIQPEGEYAVYIGI